MSLLCDVFQCDALRTVDIAIGRMAVYTVKVVILGIQKRVKASAKQTQQVKL